MLWCVKLYYFTGYFSSQLNMPDDHLRENLREFLSGLLKQQPRVEDVPFVKE